MENKALRDFLQMRSRLAEKIPPPHPKKLHMTPNGLPSFGEDDMTYAKIVAEKPPVKEVIEYFREKVNKMIEESLQ